MEILDILRRPTQQVVRAAPAEAGEPRVIHAGTMRARMRVTRDCVTVTFESPIHVLHGQTLQLLPSIPMQLDFDEISEYGYPEYDKSVDVPYSVTDSGKFFGPLNATNEDRARWRLGRRAFAMVSLEPRTREQAQEFMRTMTDGMCAFDAMGDGYGTEAERCADSGMRFAIKNRIAQLGNRLDAGEFGN